MSRSWSRRPHRRGSRHGRQTHALFDRRTCCGTTARQPHASNCRRDPMMCGVKVAFESHTRAEAHIASMAYDPALVWRTYRCPICSMFHLTTTAGHWED